MNEIEIPLDKILTDKAKLAMKDHKIRLIEEELKKYQQCLDEIERIVNADCLKCSNVASCDFDARNCSDLKINEILQLIKKVRNND